MDETVDCGSGWREARREAWRGRSRPISGCAWEWEDVEIGFRPDWDAKELENDMGSGFRFRFGAGGTIAGMYGSGLVLLMVAG